MPLRIPCILILILTAHLCVAQERADSARNTAPVDSISMTIAEEQADTSVQKKNWWTLFKQRKLDINDPDVEYPRFLAFCLKVYKWGDRTFNTYDTTYVHPGGKRWKAQIKSDNWADSYAMHLKGTDAMFLSDIVCNLGAYLSYMAVSVGYSADMTSLIGGKPQNHKKWSFNFNCALFNADAYYNENTGGAYLRKLGNYKKGHLFKHFVRNITFHEYGLDLIYFFNNKHYSHSAAYNFSRIQVKSSGSLLIGVAASNQDISIDFSELPDNILAYFNSGKRQFTFNYNDYALIIGYGYNWVFRPNWVLNVSAMPNLGWKHCLADCEGGRRNIFSANVKGRFAITYNYRQFFGSLSGRFDGHWYNSAGYSFFNSVESLMVNLGIRF